MSPRRALGKEINFFKKKKLCRVSPGRALGKEINFFKKNSLPLAKLGNFSISIFQGTSEISLLSHLRYQRWLLWWNTSIGAEWNLAYSSYNLLSSKVDSHSKKTVLLWHGINRCKTTRDTKSMVIYKSYIDVSLAKMWECKLWKMRFLWNISYSAFS